LTRFRTAPQFRSPARRVSLSAPRRAVRLGPELPLLHGWRTERQLAEGAQARIFLVHRASDRGRRPFAAKVAQLASPDGEPYRAEEQRGHLLREIAVLGSLAEAGCRNIPRVIAYGSETARSAEPWFVMPFYAGGAMWRLSESGEAQWAEAYEGNIDRVLEIAEGLVATLTLMHEGEPRCIHRDLNASNVLFATPGGAPVLADFGIAHLKGYPARPADAVPWRWRPPELACAGAETTPAADVFMLGGLIVEALCGGRDLPLRAYWPDAELPAHPEILLARHPADPRTGAVIELVGRMLASDPARRPSARGVAQACREIRDQENAALRR
jgi:serine/threonine protein kinase